MSRYSESTGQNQWSGGSKIIPRSHESAMEWAQQHLDPATYESEFGEVSEADDTTVMSFSLPAETAERIRRSAREQGLSISAYILKNLHI